MTNELSSELRLHVAGMDCADEAALVRRALAVPGVQALCFDLVGGRVDVRYDASQISSTAIIQLVAGTGLAAHTHAHGEVVHDDHRAHGHDHSHHAVARWWALASGLFILVGWAIDAAQADSWGEALLGHNHLEAGHIDHVASRVAYGLSVFAGLWPMVPRALVSMRYLRLDMHVLVCLSAIGAVAIGQWAEGAAVAFLFALAHLMEAWSIERARVAVRELVGHEAGWGEDGTHEVAGVERWIERFAAYYTPIVTAGALAVALLPPLVDSAWGVWFYRALIFLVLACPCALVISTPVTVVAAVTSAARRGVLFKGGLALERAAADPDGALARRDVILMPGAGAEAPSFAAAHAKRALGVIRQNVGLALATKLGFLVSAVLGVAPLWLAVLADTGATVAVTLNGLRLLRAGGWSEKSVDRLI